MQKVNKEQEITLLYQLIEKHFGSGVLMKFEDLTETDNDQLLNRIETMTTYNSYEAAKIANPESNIWASKLARCGRDNIFGTKVSLAELTNNYFKCNAADHCMTVEKFLERGYEFSSDDIIYDGISTKNITDSIIDVMNSKSSADSKIYILRAAALETKEPKRTRVEYVKCNFECAWHAIKAFEDGEKLYTKKSGEDFVLVDNAPEVLRYLYDLHERIETPIEWWEDAADFINQHGFAGCANGKLETQVSMTRDQWCDFARILLEQGE